MTNTQQTYKIDSIKKLPKSTTEIVGSIPAEIWEKNRSEALKNINESVTIDGFRKGMIPENVLIAKVGDMAILEEMAEMSISKTYFEILIGNKIDAIGKPNIQITKIAKGNPLEFKITITTMPEITLPDYKKLAMDEAKKIGDKKEKVTEKEIDEAILRIRKSRVKHDESKHTGMSEAEHAKAHENIEEKDLPELTDSFVKGLGDFADVPDFRNKLSEMIAEEKMHVKNEKRRIAIAEAISDATKVELPDIMVDAELRRTEAQFNSDLERMGVKMEDYLKHAKKTKDEIYTEWKPHAEKKAKLQLILNTIAVKENIKPDPKEVEDEVNHIVEHYKDADREHATTYAETILTNEKVFQWLEK